MIRLSDLFDEEQGKRVTEIISKILMKKIPTSDLRSYLITQREALEQKGMLPEYLYYSIVYHMDLPL